jgi:hypothetical protein
VGGEGGLVQMGFTGFSLIFEDSRRGSAGRESDLGIEESPRRGSASRQTSTDHEVEGSD